MAKPIVTPFATGGDKSVVPDASQPDGSVSYSQGFGPNYQQEQGTPGAKDIPRDKTNQLFHDITAAISEMQRLGFPEYYEELAPYAQGATVWRAGTVYMSTAGNNSTVPGAVGASWVVLGGDTTPVGTTIMFNAESPPAGYAIENGLAVPRSGQYAALFSVIGTRFGVGNGSTTFNLPSSGGEFPRLWVPGQTVDPGRALGSKQLDALQNIVGEVTSLRVRIPRTVTASGAFTVSNGLNSSDSSDGGQVTANVSFDASRVARTSSETRGRNVAKLACIKF